MRYFSMFSGIGGFELGIGDKGTCIGYSEIDDSCLFSYRKNFQKGKWYGNCETIHWNNVENFNLLCGGFPCQSFSVAGRRRGFHDSRGTMFFEIVRCLREKQPQVFIFENVKGLLSHEEGSTFFTILHTLDELGYDVQWEVLNSKDFGVPHNRERVFIVGHLRGGSRTEVFPIGQSKKKYTTKMGPKRQPLKFLNRNQKVISGDYFYCLDTMNTNGIRIGDDIRLPTPIERERLQGFPDGWTEGLSDEQRYKCLGNAVTVNVVEAIARKLI